MTQTEMKQRLPISRRTLLATAMAGLATPALAASYPDRSLPQGRPLATAIPRPVDSGLQAVVARLERFVADGDLPFAALRVARHGQTLVETHVNGVEAVGPDTLYRIYSMTKPVAAAATVLMVEDGALTLETPVVDIVPEFADLRVMIEDSDETEPARPMTVAHLLTHVCGLGNSWSNRRTAALYREAGLTSGAWMYMPRIGGLDGFARRLGEIPLEFQPGSDWHYGYGLDIAGLIVERVAGARLGEVLDARLFAPLGMTATGFVAPSGRGDDLPGLYSGDRTERQRVGGAAEQAARLRPLADSGSSGLVSTLADYGRFADMLAGGGMLDGVRVMRPESAQLLMTPYGPQDRIGPALERFGAFGLGGDAAGYGQALGGVTRLSDGALPGSAGEYGWGGAASTTFWVTPDLGLSVVVMTQLMPSGVVPLRDALRPLVYGAISTGA